MGFTNRFRGKSQTELLVLGRQGLRQQPFAVAQGTTVPGYGFSTISSASAASVFQLGAPPPGGAQIRLGLTQVSSGIFVKAPTGYTFDGSNPVLKATAARTIELWAVSTALLLPASTAGLTFSATT